MDLRAAVEADLPRIAALARWVWLDSYAQAGVTPAVAAYLDRAFDIASLGGKLPGRMWLVEDDGALRAWVHIDPVSACPVERDGPAIEIARLYVAPPCQGQGLGRDLLSRVRESFPGHAVWLSAWVGNAGALKFYRREGASLWGETWFELDGQRHRNEVLGWPALQKA